MTAETRPHGKVLRPEIQALRAIAVMAVVIFHLWPLALPGGFVGVDVFFAISGYLITGHLLTAMAHERGFSLTGFWARRIRRLLPAASLVLVVTLIATVIVTQAPVWLALSAQTAASAGGFENWLLAFSAVDYFGANSAPTAVQHYWSLSVEEQFYLVWAATLFAIALSTRRALAQTRRRIVIVAITVLSASSLTWSIIESFTNQQFAYFSTLTHAWEFGLGGLMAALLSRGVVKVSPRSMWLRPTLISLGVAAIVVASFSFTGTTRFPGWVAIVPVGGAVLVMVFGSQGDRRGRTRSLWIQPIEFIGAVSFALYLWHWPLIVLGPSMLGRPLNDLDKVVILFASVALAWITKVAIEDPCRRSNFLNGASWRTFTSGALATVVTVSLALGMMTWANGINSQIAAENASKIARALVHSSSSCLGAFAMSHVTDCPNAFSFGAEYGTDIAAGDWGPIAGANKDGTMPAPTCTRFGPSEEYTDCVIVPGAANAPGVALVGDSHALSLIEPIAAVAKQGGFTLRAILHNSCSASKPQDYVNPGARAHCNDWRAAMGPHVASLPGTPLVITAGFTRKEPLPDSTESLTSLADKFTSQWTDWTDAGKRVLVVEDVPLTSGEDVPACVAREESVPDPCALPREVALPRDMHAFAAASTSNPNVHLLSINEAFCDAATCHSVIGGLIAYRDFHHLTGTFAATLVNYFIEPMTSLVQFAAPSVR